MTLVSLKYSIKSLQVSALLMTLHHGLLSLQKVLDRSFPLHAKHQIEQQSLEKIVLAQLPLCCWQKNFPPHITNPMWQHCLAFLLPKEGIIKRYQRNIQEEEGYKPFLFRQSSTVPLSGKSNCITEPRVHLFLYTTSKIILPTREEQCALLLGWVFQLKWFFIGIWNKAISTPVLFSSSNNFFLLFVIMTPPHLSSVFLDIFIMSQRSCYRDSFYDSVKCWSCRSRV